MRAKFGPLSFGATHCHQSPEGMGLILFTRSLGSPNEMHLQDLCQGTHDLADILTFGRILSSYTGYQDYLNARCIFLVGTNMAASAGGSWRDILTAQKNGAKLIVVDPKRCEPAKQADLWLQIRPGTDGALGLAMLHVIINQNLYDADFVNNYCVGFDQLRDHVQQYTPEWAAEITSIPAEQIVQVARLYATNGPVSYRGNNGLAQYSNSTQSSRAFSILTAITGNIDVPGGTLMPTIPPGYGNYWRLLENNRLPREVEEQRIGANRFPLWCGPDSPIAVAHNSSVIKAIITGEPYPVKSMIIADANPVMTYPDPRRVIEALNKLEISIVLAFTPSPTSELADLILPRKHPFEQNGIMFNRKGNCLTATPKLVEPPEGCRDVIEILYRLAERMVQQGHIEKNLIPWQNMDEHVEWRLSETEFSFQDLCESGATAIELPYQKYTERGFRTPSGKVEFYSSLLERYGYEPLPVYRECAESPGNLPHQAKKYPLLLSTRREADLWLSRTVEENWFRELTPYPQLQIHPDTARERGIKPGDMVIVETPRGTFQHLAALTEDVHPQVVDGTFGWWLPERKAPERGCLETNVNAAMSFDAPYDPVVGIPSIRGLMCQVRKL